MEKTDKSFATANYKFGLSPIESKNLAVEMSINKRYVALKWGGNSNIGHILYKIQPAELCLIPVQAHLISLLSI